jgi:hypothetical protein
MNQTVAATDDFIPLQTSRDMPLNELQRDISLETLGISDKKAPRKRSIRFATNISEVVGRVLSRDDFSENEKADYWIERFQFAQIQSNARVVVTAVRKHGSAYVHCIDDAYKIAQHLSEFMVEDNAIDLFFEDPSSYTEKMEMWSEADYGQRGLERHISPLQRSQRALETRETRRMVLIAAKKGMGPDELAEIYGALSWMTCLYSRMLGHADYAVAYPEDDDPAEQLPEQQQSVRASDVNNQHRPESLFIQNLKEVLTVSQQALNLHAESQDIQVSRAA